MIVDMHAHSENQATKVSFNLNVLVKESQENFIPQRMEVTMKGEATPPFFQSQPCGNQSLKILAGAATLISACCEKELVECLIACFCQQQCGQSVDALNTEWSVVTSGLGIQRNPFLHRYLQCCNDVEENPGPLNGSDDNSSSGSNRSVRARVQQNAKEKGSSAAQGSERIAKFERSIIRDDRQKLLEGRHEIVERRLEMMGEQMDLQKNQINGMQDKSKIVEILSKRLENLEKLLNEKDCIVQENLKLKDEAVAARSTVNCYENRINELEDELNGVKSQLCELLGVYDDLQDRLYEIDRSWQNNLVFNGIKPDNGGIYESVECLEHKVKTVLRNQLNIGRDIPISRAQRIYNGSDVRGFKPVIVNFAKWSDKEDVLRKAKILKSNGIHVEEDFSRAAKFRRRELEKLAKEVKNLSPEKRCTFKYDKLIIDDNVYIYNDAEKRIERLPYSVSASSGLCLDDEVGDASQISRRLRNRNAVVGSSTIGSVSMAAKRAQSVESVLERIPQVSGTTAIPASPVRVSTSASSHMLNSVSGSTNGLGSPTNKGRLHTISPTRKGAKIQKEVSVNAE